MGHKSNDWCLYKRREEIHAQRQGGDTENKDTEIEGMQLQAKERGWLPGATRSYEETRTFSSPGAFRENRILPTLGLGFVASWTARELISELVSQFVVLSYSSPIILIITN